MPIPNAQPLKLSALTLAVLLATQLTGCGGDSDVSGAAASASSADTGSLQLAITDAEEDFLSYRIQLKSIQLVRRDGTQVSVLPLATDVDFVQYQELSELFAVLAVPAGVYERITLTLDYSNADIVIQDEEGNSAKASVVDANDAPVTTLDVNLSLKSGEELVITRGKAAQLTLDLDLAASNTIRSFSPAIVQVEPFLLATAALDGAREHRVRGLLAGVDPVATELQLTIRPMRHRQGQFGQMTVQVNGDTRYEINGVEYSGDAGLTALAALDAATPVVGYGQQSETEQGYLASRIHAGSSVDWAGSDVLKGLVTARTGNTLTLRGAVLEPEGQQAHLQREITLTLGDATEVTGYRLGDATLDTISVGQRILALGQYQNSAFDARDGLVRLQMNAVAGQVLSLEPLVLNLNSINKRPVALFDFTGTGSSSAEDTDAAAYQVNYGTLDVTHLAAQDWVHVRGYPGAFGAAPADFTALSVIKQGFSNAPARLVSLWPKDAKGGVTVTNGVLVLDTASAKSHVQVPGQSRELGRNLSVSQLVGAEQAGRYAIQRPGKGISIYHSFADFSQALVLDLQAGARVRHLTASGAFDKANGQLAAQNCTLQL